MGTRHLLRLELANDLLLARGERRAFEQDYIDIRTNATLFENEQKRQLRSLLAGVTYPQRLGHYGRLEEIAHERLKHASPAPTLTLALVVALLAIALVIGPVLSGLLIGTKDVNESVINIGQSYGSNATLALAVFGKLHSVMLAGTYSGNGTVNVYLRIGDTRYLVLDRSDIVGKGVAKLTGFDVLEVPAESNGNQTQAPEIEPELNISEPVAEPDLSINESVSTNNETVPDEPAVNKTLGATLVYGTTPAFDTDNDGVELVGGGIDFQITSNEDLSGHEVCTQWEAQIGGISDYSCYGSAQCCALSDLQSSYDNWNQSFILTGAGNYSVAARIVAFNTTDFTARKSDWQSLGASFVEAQQTQKNYSFSGLCRDSCLLDGINVSDAVLEIDMEDGTLYLDNLTYSILVEQLIAPNPINETNETNNVSITQNPVIETNQLGAEVGKPVQWVKRVRISDTNATLELPPSASNISVIRDEAELDDYKVKIKEKEKEFTPDTFELEKKIKQLEGKKSFGALSVEEPQNLSVTISDSPGEVEVMFETPGPKATEWFDGNKKLITVESDIHYTNITATASLSSSTSQLYWLPSDDDYRLYYDSDYIGQDSKRVLISEDVRFKVSYLDLDGNGVADTISWIVPHLSNQTYEISIVVLNPVTYLRDGETWVVAFNTTGTADLTINSTNSGWEEMLTDDNLTFDEMRFLNLSCGENNLRESILVYDASGTSYNFSQIQPADSIRPKEFFISDYSCNETAYFSNHMKKAGYAIIDFRFGSEMAQAIDPWQTYPGGAWLKSIQYGKTSIPFQGNNISVSINTINLSSSILFFSMSGNLQNPRDVFIAGNITNSTHLYFQKNTAGLTPDVIQWQVAEFSRGVKVQRGTSIITEASLVTTTKLDQAITNISQTFLLMNYNLSNSASSWGPDHLIQGKIMNTTHIRFSRGGASRLDPVEVKWQVVEYSSAKVINGTYVLTNSADNITLPNSINTSKSFVIATFDTQQVVDGNNYNPANISTRINITNSTSIKVERNSTGFPLNISYFVVQFTGDETVENTSIEITGADTIASNFGSSTRENRSNTLVVNPSFGYFTYSSSTKTNPTGLLGWSSALMSLNMSDYFGTPSTVFASRVGQFNNTFADIYIITFVTELPYTPISSCQNLTTPNSLFKLSNNVNSTGTCFEITSPNIVLDCAGFTVNYSVSTQGYGVKINASNVTVMNCNITGFGGSPGTSNNAGVFLSAVNNVTITRNNITTNGTSSNYGVEVATGFFVGGATNVTISNNVILARGSSSDNIGVRLDGINIKNFVLNNSVRTNGTGSNYGLYVVAGGFVVIDGNVVSTSGSSKANYGIYMRGTGNNSVLNNTVRTNGTNDNYGLMVFNGGRNVLRGNDIISSGSSAQSHGILINGSSANVITFNTIVANASLSAGINLTSSNNNISNNTVRSTSIMALWLNDSASSNIIYNNLLNGTTQAVVITGTPVNQWNTTLQAGTNIIGDSWIGGNFYANSTGNEFSQTCTDANFNGICDSSNTLAANNVDFYPLTVPFDGNISLCANLSVGNTLHRLAKNVNATGTCFQITSPNIVLDCAGFTVNYSVSTQGYGVKINASNVTVQNCNITGFGGSPGTSGNTGVYVRAGTNVSVLRNNITTNGTSSNYGVDVDGYNVTISNNVIFAQGTSSSNSAVRLAGSGNNSVLNNSVRTNGTISNAGLSATTGGQNVLSGNTVISDGSGSNNYGINLAGDNNSVLNNSVRTNGTTNNFGLYVTSGGLNALNGNSVITGGSSDNNQGVRLEGSGNNSVLNNSVRTNGVSGNYGVYLASGGLNVFSGNSFVTSGSTISNYGIRLDGSGNNSVLNNSVTTNGTSNNYGLYVSAGGFNVLNENLVFAFGSSDSNYGVYLDGSGNNSLINNTISTNGTSGNFGLYVVAGGLNVLSGNYIVAGGTLSSNFGVRLDGSGNNSVLNNTIRTNGTQSNYGLYVSAGGFNVLSGNVVNTGGSSNANYGVRLDGSGNNSVLMNNVSTNGTGTNSGLYVFAGGLNVLSGNYVVTDGSSSFNAGIRLAGVDNNSVLNNTVRTNGTIQNYGLYVFAGGFNVLSGNVVSTGGSSNTNYGIILSGAGNNSVLNNSVRTNGTDSNFGLYVFAGGLNVIRGNDIISSGTTTASHGVYIRGVGSNDIAFNTIVANASRSAGINLTSSSNNVTNNTARSTSIMALWLNASASSNIFYNNLLNGTTQAVIIAGTQANQWNTTLQAGTNIVGGSLIGGNFYANASGNEFSQTCADGNADGICDSSNTLAASNVDAYPLAAQVGQLDSCANLTTVGMTYSLNSSVNSTGTCFTILANNVTLDCGGHLINYSQAVVGHGIFINASNITVSNCRVFQGSNIAKSMAIKTNQTNVSGLRILNNTIYTNATNAYGIHLLWVWNSVVINNTIMTHSSYGIISETSNGINITHNRVQNASTAIEIYQTPNAVVQYNVVNASIYVESDSPSAIISDNQIQVGKNSDGITFYLSANYGAMLRNNITLVPGTSSAGIVVEGRKASNATIRSNRVLGDNVSGYGIINDQAGCNFTDNYVELNGSGSANVVLWVNQRGSIYSNNTIIARGTSRIGLLIDQGGNNTFINNTIFSNQSYAVAIDPGAPNFNNTFINNLFNGSNRSVYVPNGLPANYWNGTLQSGTNIIGGHNLGGNFYANSTGNEFSQTCADGDMNGICDDALTFGGNNTDYYPLATSYPIKIGFSPPTDPNASIINRNWTYINFSVNRTSGSTLDTVILSWNGTNVTIDGPDLLGLFGLNNDTLDHSRYGHNGTMMEGANCSSGIPGRLGSACRFDGIDDYINATGFTSLGVTDQPYTIMGWVNPDSLSNNMNVILLSENTQGSGYCFNPMTVFGTNLRAWSWNGGAVSAFSTTTLTVNTWYHFATSWDPNNGLRIYVNGILENTTAQATYVGSGLPMHVHIGRNSSSCVGYPAGFNGSIDEVRLWNRSLSGAEIGASYKMELGRYYANVTNLAHGNYTYYGWANDSTGSWNSTETRVLSASLKPPYYSNFNNNNSNVTHHNGSVLWQIVLLDDIKLGSYIFSSNATGIWRNTSWTSLSGTSQVVSIINRTTARKNQQVCAIFYVNNSVNLTNQTIMGESGACFNLTNAPPQMPSIIFPISNNVYNATPLNFNASAFDVDNDTVTYYFFINGSLNSTSTTGNSTFNGSSGIYNLTVGTFDGFNWSVNSSPLIFTLHDSIYTYACGNLSASGLYTLQNNVNSTGTCFQVTTPNIVLDCGGYTANYSVSTQGYGVKINASNVTVMNCNITGFGGSPGTSNNEGVLISSDSNVTITRNNITTNGTSANYGVEVSGGYNVTISNNAIFAQGITSSNYGVRLGGSGNNSVVNNSVRTNGTNSNFGLYVSAGGLNVFSGNSVITGGSASDNYGVLLDGSGNNSVLNNSVLTNGSGSNFGLYVSVGGLNVFSGNSVITGGLVSTNYGVRLRGSGNNSVLNNSVLTTGTSDNYGVYLNSNNNTVWNNNVFSSGTSDNNHGIFVYRANSSIIANNTVVSNSTVSSVGINVTESANNTIYNNLFNATKIAAFSDTVFSNQWNTTLQPGTNIVGGVYLGGNFYANQTSNEFSQTCADADNNGICDSSNTIAANNIDYYPLTTINPGLNITSACGNLTNTGVTYRLNQSVNSTGTCFEVQSSDVSVDCNGFMINYSQSLAGFGFLIGPNMVNVSNVTIMNCSIVSGGDNANHSIYGFNVTRSTLRNNTITLNLSTVAGALPIRFVRLTHSEINTTNMESHRSGGIFLEAATYVNITGSVINITSWSSNAQGINGSINDSIIEYVRIWNNASNGAGIGLSKVRNTTVRFSDILTLGSDTEGIELVTAREMIIHDNYINTTGRLSGGIYHSAFVTQGSNFTRNNITTSGSSSSALELANTPFDGSSYVVMNRITTLGSSGIPYGIIVEEHDYTWVLNNFINSTGIAIDTAESGGMLIANNSIYSSGIYGIQTFFYDNQDIIDNNITMTGSGRGIYISQSERARIRGNRITTESGEGILDYAGSAGNDVSFNLITSTAGIGIISDNSFSNLTNNNITAYDVGLDVGSIRTENNITVINNTITSTNTYALTMATNYQDLLIYNNVFNGDEDSISVSTVKSNQWNTSNYSGTNLIGGSQIGGNFYWAKSGLGYSQTCADANYDGICDAAYVIGTNNTDFYPLTNLSSRQNVSLVNCSDLTIENAIYNLTTNISSVGTCINVLASHVTLECNSNIINYSQSQNGYGINISAGYGRFTMRNCIIYDGSTAANHSVYVKSVRDIYIENSSLNLVAATGATNYPVQVITVNNLTVLRSSLTSAVDNALTASSSNGTIAYNRVMTTGASNGPHGIFGGFSNSFVMHNLITTVGGDGYGIVFDDVRNTIFSNNITVTGKTSHGIYMNDDNNNITYNKVSTVSGVGIYLSIVVDTVVAYNEINTSNASTQGIYTSVCSNVLIHNNSVKTSGQGSYGLYTNGGTNVSFGYNNVTTNATDADGIFFTTSTDSLFVYNNRITTVNLSADGIVLSTGSDHSVIYNNTLLIYGPSAKGIVLQGALNNTIYNNTVHVNQSYAIELTGQSGNNSIYNNYFNGSVNATRIALERANRWNTTFYNATNIIGGNLTGGNYYANSTGGGYSQTCTDANADGICDSGFTLGGNNTDFYPLTFGNDFIAPTWSTNATNATSIMPKFNDSIHFNVTLADNVALGNYVFSWNASGAWQNDTAMGNLGGASYLLQINKTANATQRALFGWMVFFNDSSGNRNQTDIFTVQMINTPPYAPTLIAPINHNLSSNRTPMFIWSGNTDADLDNLTYDLNITKFGGDGTCTMHSYVNVTNISNAANHTLNVSNELQCLYDDGRYYYNWSVRAFDGLSFSPWSTSFNYSVLGEIGLLLVNNTVAFGQLQVGDMDNTTDGSPAPLLMENTGNVYVNVSINATALWVTQPANSTYYQYKISNASARNMSFNYTTSNTTFQFIPLSSNSMALRDYDYHDASDWARIEILLSVPVAEPFGNKESTIVFWGARTR